jgi:hypothetical protein
MDPATITAAAAGVITVGKTLYDLYDHINSSADAREGDRQKILQNKLTLEEETRKLQVVRESARAQTFITSAQCTVNLASTTMAATMKTYEDVVRVTIQKKHDRAVRR